jgi:hypothetical protein
MALLGAWLLVRVSRRSSLAAATSVAVVAAIFGLGLWSFGDMRVNQGPPEGHGPDSAGSRRGKSAEWFQASAPAHGHPPDVRRSALAECRHTR